MGGPGQAVVGGGAAKAQGLGGCLAARLALKLLVAAPEADGPTG